MIPAADYDQLFKVGVAHIFGPGTPIPKSGMEVIKTLLSKSKTA